ncbi:molybdopterin-guanine dinucleotide biosynthesis protein B [Oricola sp.]|uniref:molybdopterin-guanine dinucleotide biosynthesis protein B n=1 Tax=Oricola sp. TaxID=1979950 RepID=UPI003BAC4434
MNDTPRIFGIAGWKNSGKTRMTAALVAELSARGWTVSTIKHAHHAFDIDRENTDSWQHRQAGAAEVAIVSQRRWALMHENRQDEDEPSLDEILGRLSPCDLVLVEGYKSARHAKIEMRRNLSTTKARLSDTDPGIVAIVTDDPKNAATNLPVFGHDDIAAIADLVERRSGLVKDSAA